jgi:photosystem II stability/assembly factor-like uncharacterized protein
MKVNIGILTSIIVVITVSCTKPNDPPPNPPIIEKDSLLGDWQRINTGFTTIDDVWFLDARKGFISTPTGIYSSLDSGKTWNLITGNNRYFNLYFLNSQIGYAQGSPDFAYTADGGTTWVKKTLPFYQAKNCWFISPSTGFVTTSGGLYKTVDTGNTWKVAIPRSFDGIFFKDSKIGWLESDSIFKTTDGGQTWQGLVRSESISDQYIHTLQFTDDLHGWLTYSTLATKTVDGGKSWSKTEFSPEATSDVHFFDNNVGYLSTVKGIYKTKDGGLTWAPDCKLDSGAVSQMFFIDEHTGWASGGDGTFLRLKN